MGKNTGIEWTDATWNPIRGCSRTSEGCRFCYAESIAARFSGPGKPYEGLARMTPSGPRWTGEVRFIERHLHDPIRWKTPLRIFVNSMSDLYHEDVPCDWIQAIYDVMVQARHHVYQILTKRADRMERVTPHVRLPCGMKWRDSVEKHIWLGVSVENQEAAENRIPCLLRTPAVVRFLSIEPLLEPVTLKKWLHHGISWCIVGAESGVGRRPMNLEWVRTLRDECVAANVSFFFKQAEVHGRIVGKPELDGRTWLEFPQPTDAPNGCSSLASRTGSW